MPLVIRAVFGPEQPAPLRLVRRKSGERPLGLCVVVAHAIHTKQPVLPLGLHAEELRCCGHIGAGRLGGRGHDSGVPDLLTRM